MNGDSTPEGPAPSVSEVASAYVDGEVGADQLTWVEANRAHDANLAAEIDGFARTKSLLAGLGVPRPGDGGWDAIGEGVRRGVATESRRTWTARVAALAAALVLVAAVALGTVLVVGRSAPESPPQATPALLTPSPTRGGSPRSGTGAVAAARGIGSVVERVGVSPRAARSTTSTTTTRPPFNPLAPPR